MHAATSSTIGELGRPRALQAILLGGLTAGILDGLDAVVFYRLWAGVPAFRIFQHIASGLLGAKAPGYGLYSMLLGVVLHQEARGDAAARARRPALLAHVLRRRLHRAPGAASRSPTLTRPGWRRSGPRKNC